MSELQCIVVTPETTVRDTVADFVALPLFDGEIGVAPGHTPMIGRLGYGEMRIRQGERTARYYVEGGFVEVLGNVVSVLTGRAVPAESVDALVAQEQLDTARSRTAHTPDELEQRQRAVSQARAQVWVARRVGQ
jgi:F-type H+-transporting ATPase subunit epsilon